MTGQGFTFEHKSDGPNGWVIAGTGWLVGIGLVIMALALFSLANWLGAALATWAVFFGWSTLVVAVGESVFLTCKGAALVIRAKGQARAMEKQAAAQLTAARRGVTIMVDEQAGFTER